LHEPTANLDAVEREMIAVACTASSPTALRSGRHWATLSSPTVSRSTTGGRGFGERSAAILDFAVKITDHPLERELEDLERLKGFGLSEEEVWDVVETSCP
jgi:uncharacterized protein YciW